MKTLPNFSGSVDFHHKEGYGLFLQIDRDDHHHRFEFPYLIGKLSEEDCSRLFADMIELAHVYHKERTEYKSKPKVQEEWPTWDSVPTYLLHERDRTINDLQVKLKRAQEALE